MQGVLLLWNNVSLKKSLYLSVVSTDFFFQKKKEEDDQELEEKNRRKNVYKRGILVIEEQKEMECGGKEGMEI